MNIISRNRILSPTSALKSVSISLGMSVFAMGAHAAAIDASCVAKGTAISGNSISVQDAVCKNCCASLQAAMTAAELASCYAACVTAFEKPTNLLSATLTTEGGEVIAVGGGKPILQAPFKNGTIKITPGTDL